MGLWNVK